jgi:hypothetical protein
MTGMVAVTFGVLAAAVVALGYAVMRLHTQVESLARQVADGLPCAPPLPAATQLAKAYPQGSQAHAPVEPPVALITDFSRGSVEQTEPTVAEVVSVTLAAPLIKVAALSHGLRYALRADSRMRIGYAVRRELKQQRKLRRRRSTHRTPSQANLS